MNPSMSAWTPSGTVYGTLLNFRREWDLWSARMTQDPHKAPPKAPVLYVKSANTFCPAGQDLLLQDGVSEVDIGATLGLVIGEQAQVVGAVLLNDWSVPHTSYYRPPVKFRCRDGYLALPAQTTACRSLSDWNALEIEVRLNDAVITREQMIHADEHQYDLIAKNALALMKQTQCYIAVRGSHNITENSDIPNEKMQMVMAKLLRMTVFY